VDTSTSNNVLTVIQVVGLIGSIATIILGIIAIWLSLYFYRRNNELSNSLNSIISRIEAQTRATEITSTNLITPVVSTVLAAITDSMTSRVENVGRQITQRSAASVERLLMAVTGQEKQRAREEFIKEIDSLVGILRHEVVPRSQTTEAGGIQPMIPGGAGTVVTIATLPPGSPTYNWTPFIRRIRDLENTHPFLSVKWLRENRFAREPQTQEALQVAIDRRMLETYHLDNPNNPSFPTLCCKLNPEHSIASRILESIGELEHHSSQGPGSDPDPRRAGALLRGPGGNRDPGADL
jgi:hypothetical protein